MSENCSSLNDIYERAASRTIRFLLFFAKSFVYAGVTLLCSVSLKVGIFGVACLATFQMTMLRAHLKIFMPIISEILAKEDIKNYKLLGSIWQRIIVE